MRRQTKKIHEGYTLPLEAFRTSMLDGTLALVPQAGDYNIPPHSQTPPIVELGVVPKVDYLSFIWLASDISETLEMVQAYSCCIFDREDFKPYKTTYAQSYRAKGSRGSTMEYKSIPGEGYHVRFSMGGNACGGISLEAMGLLLSRLYDCPGAHCSRLDYTADDYHGILNLDTIASCLSEGNYRGYKCGEVIESHGGKRAGKTVYFGGRKSLQRVRFYDKMAESGGDIPCVRQEVQCRGERAEEIAKAIQGKSLEDIWTELLGRLSGAITMGLRRDKNATRIKVADFWKEWRAALSRTTIEKTPIVRSTSLPRTIAWMKKSVSKSLAKLSQAMPIQTVYDFCLYLIKTGTDKIRVHEMEEIRQWEEEGGDSDLMLEMMPVLDVQWGCS